MTKIGLSDRECAQILMALVAYRNIFNGMKMPVTDMLITKFNQLTKQDNNERKGDSDL